MCPDSTHHTLTVRHVCERILAQLSRVIQRDSSVSEASPQDLYVALAEDECIYGWFSRLKGEPPSTKL